MLHIKGKTVKYKCVILNVEQVYSETSISTCRRGVAPQNIAVVISIDMRT